MSSPSLFKFMPSPSLFTTMPVAAMNTSISPLEPYLAGALEELHEASRDVDVSEWKSVRDCCVPAFRNMRVRLTRETRGPLANLRDTLKDIAYSLYEIKLRGDIPRWNITDVKPSESKQQAAEQISHLPSALNYLLGRYLQTNQVESNLTQFKEALLRLQNIASQLQSALNSDCWHQNAVQVNKAIDNTIEGLEQCGVGNVCFGPPGAVSASCTTNRTNIRAPENLNSRVNTSNRSIVLDGKSSTLAEKYRAICTYVHARARQVIVCALDVAMCLGLFTPQYRLQMPQVRNLNLSIGQHNSRKMYKSNRTSSYRRSPSHPLRQFLRHVTQDEDNSCRSRQNKFAPSRFKVDRVEPKFCKDAEKTVREHEKMTPLAISLNTITPILTTTDIERLISIPPRSAGLTTVAAIDLQLDWLLYRAQNSLITKSHSGRGNRAKKLLRWNLKDAVARHLDKAQHIVATTTQDER